MLCINCGSKGLVRGVKPITCSICSKQAVVNVISTDICLDCCNQYDLCEICGSQALPKKDTEYVLLKWGE